MSVRRLKLVITTLDFGGAEQRLVDLATKIDRVKFAPSVVALAPRPRDDEDHLVRRLEEADVPVRFLNAGGLASGWRTWRNLRREFRENPCDLVQSFLFHANVLTAYCLPRGLPHFAGIRVADPRQSRLFLERRALRRAKKIVCVSNSVADHLLHSRYSTSQIVTIPNGVDTDLLEAVAAVSKQSLDLPRDAQMVAVIGRLDKQKGTDWLIEHVADLTRDHDRLHFVFCGRGDTELYRRRATQLGIDKRVHFLGWRGDVAGILKSADLLMLPSRWEGMPNVVLEAMTVGVPIVATPTHGVMEVLGPNARQMTFPQGDVEMLRERMVFWLGERSEPAAQWLDDNRYRAVNEFPAARMVRRYERLYDQGQT